MRCPRWKHTLDSTSTSTSTTMEQASIDDLFQSHRPAAGAAGAGAGPGAGAGADVEAAVLDPVAVLYTPRNTNASHYAYKAESHNPTPEAAIALFNITEVVGSFATSGARRIPIKLQQYNMAVIPAEQRTRSQQRRRAMVLKYTDVARLHGAGLPRDANLRALLQPPDNLQQHLSSIGQLSYFCVTALERGVTYGDLGYLLDPLTGPESRAMDVPEYTTVFDAFMKWSNQRRSAAAHSATVEETYASTVGKSRTGRDGTEAVTVSDEDFRPQTYFNRCKAWQYVAGAAWNDAVQRRDRAKQAALAGDNNGAVVRRLAHVADLAEGRYHEVTAVVARCSSNKKDYEREAASAERKALHHRLVELGELVKGLKAMYTGLRLGNAQLDAKQVQQLGEYLLIAFAVFIPPVRKAMYIDMDVHDVVWSRELDTYVVKVTDFFKTHRTAAIDRVVVVEQLVEPLARYLAARRTLRPVIGTLAKVHWQNSARALFVNKHHRRHSSTSALGVVKAFGRKYCRLSALGLHIMRDIFTTSFYRTRPHLDSLKWEAIAAQVRFFFFFFGAPRRGAGAGCL